MAKKTSEEQREAKRAYNKKWRAEHKEELDAYIKNWLVENKDKNKASKVAYAIKNADHLRAKRREKAAQRRETDDNYRIKQTLQCRLNNALRKSGAKRAANTKSLIGCDIDFLRGFLEARFLPGMNWTNHGLGKGKWQIDHHAPLAEFDLRDPVQQKQACHYSNLRPMWGVDNRRKGAKRPPTHQAELI